MKWELLSVQTSLISNDYSFMHICNQEEQVLGPFAYYLLQFYFPRDSSRFIKNLTIMYERSKDNFFSFTKSFLYVTRALVRVITELQNKLAYPGPGLSFIKPVYILVTQKPIQDSVSQTGCSKILDFKTYQTSVLKSIIGFETQSKYLTDLSFLSL